jgi:outer membrane protein assembly factor BamB
MSRREFVLLLFLVAVGSSGCRAARDNKKDADDDIAHPEPAFLPGGIADSSGKTGYLSNPQGGIDAVDLASGKVLWHSDQASHPLLIYKDRLYAQQRHDVNPIRIVGLSLSGNNAPLLVSDPIELFASPEPAHIDPKLRPSRQLPPDPKEYPVFCAARMEQGQLHVEWEFERGAAQVHPKTGKVTQLRRELFSNWPRSMKYGDIAKIAADPHAFGTRLRLTRVPKKALEDPLPRDLFQISEDGRPKGGLGISSRWLSGDALAVLVGRSDGRNFDTILVCWDMNNGKNLRSFRVATGSSGKDYQSGTSFLHVADQGRYVVTGTPRFRRNPPPTYYVFSVETGTQLHQLTPPDEYSEPWPVGARAFYCVREKDRRAPSTLKAVDMATQKLLWERAIGGRQRPISTRLEP